jgi:hypothetical protein
MQERGVCRFWWGNLRERNHSGDPGVDGRIILGWILRKWDVGVWTGLGWLRIRQLAGRCECGNETTGNFLTSYTNRLASQEGLCSIE